MRKKLFCIFAALGGFFLNPTSVLAQGTAFTYQGQLNAGGSPASGSYDLRFALYDAVTSGNQIAGPLTNSATAVNNGLFTVAVNFGGVFTGTNYWLEIAARTNGGGGFTTLSPRQQITPAPYAIYAAASGNVTGAISAAQLTGTAPLSALPAVVVTNNEAGLTLSGTFSGNGAGLTNLSATANLGSTSLATIVPGATNVIDFGAGQPAYVLLTLPANFTSLTLAVTNVNSANTALIKNIFITAGAQSYSLTVPTNWITQSVAGSSLVPAFVPSGCNVQIVLTVLCGSSLTNYYAQYAFTANNNLDPDAAQFVAAAGIAGATNITAVNNLVVSLKSANLWYRWDALYPLMGGTANSCAWNLRNPGIYKINWTTGSSTFDVTGWTSDGSVSYGDTGFNPSTVGLNGTSGLFYGTPAYSQNSATLFVYTTTKSPTAGDYLGATDSTARAGLIAKESSAYLADDGFNNASGPGADIVIPATNYYGALALTRTAANASAIYGNVQTNNTSLSASSGVPNTSFAIGSRNTSSGPANFIAAKFAFVAIGGGLSSSDFTTMSNLVYNFEAALGRQ